MENEKNTYITGSMDIHSLRTSKAYFEWPVFMVLRLYIYVV